MLKQYQKSFSINVPIKKFIQTVSAKQCKVFCQLLKNTSKLLVYRTKILHIWEKLNILMSADSQLGIFFFICL